MSDNIRMVIEDIVSSYFEKINWENIVGPAVLEKIEVKTKADYNFVNEIVDSISMALSDNVSGEQITEEIMEQIKLRTVSFDQTPNVEESGNMICSKCYRPFGVWTSTSGNSFSDQTIISNGKSILMMDDF